MKPKESFVGQPVRSLQTMLRFIAESQDIQPSVIPDGIYGQDTVNAVSDFQRRKGQRVTGITDQDTWDAIVAEYENALLLVGTPTAVEVLLDSNQVIRRGEKDPHLHLAQAILTVLSEAYSSITPPSRNGILDIATAESLISFQVLNGLEATGELDRITWHNLALQYPLAVATLLSKNKS